MCRKKHGGWAFYFYYVIDEAQQRDVFNAAEHTKRMRRWMVLLDIFVDYGIPLRSVKHETCSFSVYVCMYVLCELLLDSIHVLKSV